jgi:U4/U6 small nuclear ribonucleoprotein PRP3
VFGDEVKAVGTIRADIVPTVEWWDRPILSQESYCEGLNSGLISRLTEMKKDGVSIKDIEKEAETRLLPSVVHLKSEAITWEVDHPTPVYTAPINMTSHTVVMHLTDIEKRKLKRLKKAKKLQDLREKMKLGLLQPPPQKIKLSNMVKLLAKEATADPSRTEQEVMEKYNQRLQQHEQRNEERKLSKPQKLERALRKLRRDSARESRTVIFRVERLQHKKNLFKVMKNAEQLALVGACIRLPEGQPTLLVVEGGKQALKMYKNLCLRRIDWKLEVPPGSCNVVWEAEIKDAVFRRFSIKEVASELEARKLLGKRGVEHYFDLVNNWKPPAEL